MHLKRNFVKVFVAVFVIMSVFVNLVFPSNALIACEEKCKQESGTSLSTRVSAEALLTQDVQYDWGITKTVNESSATLALSDAADFHYTVTAARIPAGTDLQATVGGIIEVTNCGDRPTENLTIKIQLLYKIGKGKYQPLTELQGIVTDMLPSGQKRAYTYSIPFTPVENASYKVETYTTITNHAGHIGLEYGPQTAADFLVPTQPVQRVEDKTAIVNDEMIMPEGFDILSTGIFPWAVAEANLVVGEDGIGSAEQNYTVTVRNNSAQNNSVFALINTAALKESCSKKIHEASQTVTINTEYNTVAEGGAVDSEVSASGFWNRKLVYDWAITKTAEPASLSLAPGSSETVKYILNVKRILTEDSVEACGVAGMLTVKNTGNAATQNLQINVQVRAKNETEYQDMVGAAQMIIPAQQLAVGEEGNYNYNINFNPVPGAEYKVVARIAITNYARQQGIPYETNSEQHFTLPVAPEETRVDHTAVVNDQVSSLEGFTIIGGLTDPWGITEADLADPVEGRNGQSATRNYSVTIINTSAQANSTFTLNNMVMLTEDDSKAAREAQAKVIIVTPEEPVIDPGEPTDNDAPKKDPDDSATDSEHTKKEHDRSGGESTNSANEIEVPYEEITPPQDEAPMIPNNMVNSPDENPVPDEVINPPVQKEPLLPYTGGHTGLCVTLGMIFTLYGNGLRRKQK